MAPPAVIETEVPTRTEPTKPRWWKRPWIVPLWAVTAIFVIWRVPNYLGFTPESSLSPIRSYEHYLLLSGHIVLGAVALVCCCLQVWPWLRKHHPKAHRVSGRVYVAVVIPGSALAVVSSVMAVTTPPSGRAGNVMLCVVWLATTIVGFRMARARRFAEHRRWMIRSFALCFSIVMNRLWIGIAIGVLLPFLDGYYGGDVDRFTQDVAVMSIWSSWIVNLLIAEWWIERTRRPRKRATVKVATPTS